MLARHFEKIYEGNTCGILDCWSKLVRYVFTQMSATNPLPVRDCFKLSLPLKLLTLSNTVTVEFAFTCSSPALLHGLDRVAINEQLACLCSVHSSRQGLRSPV